MSDTFNFGVIGAGVISQYHSKAIEEQPDGKIIAVADPFKASADKFAAEHNCEVHSDWQEMVKRDDIDAVCVCTPTGLHAEHALGALKAGKHVIVEKSMAITLKEATDMIRLAQDKDRKLAVIFQKRTEGAPNRIKKAIADGLFGKLVYGDASMKYWRNQDYYDSASWRGTWAGEGGGATMTQGTHGIDLLLYMMGDIESIYGKTDMVAHEGIEVEDVSIALLKFKNGAFGRIQSCTAGNPGMGNIFEINGTLGSAVLVEDTITSWAFSNSKDEIAKETIEDVKGEAGTAASDAKVFPVEGHIKQMRNFIDAARSGVELICSGEEGRRSLALILALYESARRKEEVIMDEFLADYQV
ncbi:Gfo/Idh/MocA family protein [Candidatus Latescibacterota bacterium]